MLDTSEALKAFHDMGKNGFPSAVSSKRVIVDFGVFLAGIKIRVWRSKFTD